MKEIEGLVFALLTVLDECERGRAGQPGYDITLDHLYEEALAALNDYWWAKARLEEKARVRDEKWGSVARPTTASMGEALKRASEEARQLRRGLA